MSSLRALRRRQGLTILEAARRTGLPARTIAELEHGLRPLGTAERESLARAYHFAAAELEEAPPRPPARSRQVAARGLFQPLILAAVAATLVATLLAGRALAGTSAQVAAASARSAAHDIRQPPAPTARPPRRAAKRAPLAAAAPALPTATPPPQPRPTPPAAALAQAQRASATASPSAAPSPETQPRNSLFMPLPAGGAFHQNVVAALEANDGALQHVVIPPDGVWSFNRSVGNPDLLRLESIDGVYGGGWCDLASRYTMVLRPLLPREAFEFIRHVDSTGFGLQGVPDDDGVVIWNANGADGDQDLRIRNTIGRTIRVDVTQAADGLQFQATIG